MDFQECHLHGASVRSNYAISGLAWRPPFCHAIEMRFAPLAPNQGSQTEPELPDSLLPWLGANPHILYRWGSTRHRMLAACSASGERIAVGWWSRGDGGFGGLDPVLLTYLLGNLVGMALRVRGHCVLHGNAARIGDRSIAWLGDKGTGKSTLSAAFLDAGYDLITDDQLVLYPNGEVWRPGFGVPRIRLWRDSLAHTAADIQGAYQQPFGEAVKGWLATGTEGLTEVTGPPVAGIYILAARKGTPSQVSITPLSPGQRLQLLHRHRLARRSLPLPPARQQAEFAILACLASQVPICSVQLPDDLHSLPAVVKKLVERFRPSVAA